MTEEEMVQRILLLITVLLVSALLVTIWVVRTVIIHHKQKHCVHSDECVCSKSWCLICDWYKREGK